MGQGCHVLSIGEFVESDIARASRKNWPRWKRIVISCVREAHGKGLYTVVMVDRGKEDEVVRSSWRGFVLHVLPLARRRKAVVSGVSEPPIVGDMPSVTGCILKEVLHVHGNSLPSAASREPSVASASAVRSIFSLAAQAAQTAAESEEPKQRSSWDRPSPRVHVLRSSFLPCVGNFVSGSAEARWSCTSREAASALCSHVRLPLADAHGQRRLYCAVDTEPKSSRGSS